MYSCVFSPWKAINFFLKSCCFSIVSNTVLAAKRFCATIVGYNCFYKKNKICLPLLPWRIAQSLFAAFFVFVAENKLVDFCFFYTHKANNEQKNTQTHLEQHWQCWQQQYYNTQWNFTETILASNRLFTNRETMARLAKCTKANSVRNVWTTLCCSVGRCRYESTIALAPRLKIATRHLFRRDN